MHYSHRARLEFLKDKRITRKGKGKIKFETKKRGKNNYAIRGRADTVKHKEAKCAICAVGFEGWCVNHITV